MLTFPTAVIARLPLFQDARLSCANAHKSSICRMMQILASHRGIGFQLRDEVCSRHRTLSSDRQHASQFVGSEHNSPLCSLWNVRLQGHVSDATFSQISMVTELYNSSWWGAGEPIAITALPRHRDTKVAHQEHRILMVYCRGLLLL